MLGPTSKQGGGAGEAGRGHSRDSSPKLAKGILHTIKRRAQYISWGNWPRDNDCCLGAGWVLDTG